MLGCSLGKLFVDASRFRTIIILEGIDNINLRHGRWPLLPRFHKSTSMFQISHPIYWQFKYNSKSNHKLQYFTESIFFLNKSLILSTLYSARAVATSLSLMFFLVTRQQNQESALYTSLSRGKNQCLDLSAYPYQSFTVPDGVWHCLGIIHFSLINCNLFNFFHCCSKFNSL